MLFEAKTIRVGAFDERGRRRLEILAGYFSGDCLLRAREKPVSVLCGRRVMELAGRVLDGRSDYDPCAFFRVVRNGLDRACVHVQAGEGGSIEHEKPLL